MTSAERSTEPLARRVLLMVWDGLRPDLVSEQATPNLFRLAATGVRFTNSHAVYPTVTRVNASAIATGMLPARHGIPSNQFCVPGDLTQPSINTGLATDLERLRAGRAGRILSARTLAECLAAAGRTSVVVSTGSPGSTLLQHPEAVACGGRLIHPALMVGIAPEQIEARLGPMPPKSMPNTEQNAYATRIITDLLLTDAPPDYLAFWHCDPDHTQHARGIGHPETIRALADADRNLGALLAALTRLGLADDTAVIVTSDHGFSSITQRTSLVPMLVAAGLKQDSESTDVIVLPDMAYLSDDATHRITTITEQLLRHPAVGPVFTGARGGPTVPGTLDLRAIGGDGECAPDILFSPAWSDVPNEHGYAGSCWSMAATGTTMASHGSISPWDVRNTLIVGGAGFGRGLVSDTPAGNLDLMPTILRLLGEPVPDGLDGRVIAEALCDGPSPSTVAVERTVLISEYDGRRQTVQQSRVGSTAYLDFGTVER